MLRRKKSLAAPRPTAKGLYPLAEVARLLHVQPAAVRRWSRVIGEVIHERVGTLIPPADGGNQSAWSFVELIDLLFVERLVAAGLPLRDVALFASETAAWTGSDHPFAARRFKDFVAKPKRTKEGNGSNHMPAGAPGTFAARGDALAAILYPLFEKLDFNAAAHAVRYWPLGRQRRVVLDPRRKFGRPIDAPTRVLTETLFDAVRAGGGQDASVVAKWFDVPLEAVQAAVRFEQELRGK